ncbi:hypothetical protein LTS18_001835, partial [Coniosporium uncinatum]
MAGTRNVTQPTYDFLTGGASPPHRPLRETFRQSQAIRAGIGNEELRAQIKTLQYEVNSMKEERELTSLQHQNDLRTAESRAEAEFSRAQAAERNSKAASTKHGALAREFQEAQDRATNEKADLEKKLRRSSEENRSLREEVEEAQTQLSELDRQNQYKLNEIETKRKALQATLDQVQADLNGKTSALQSTQQKLSVRDKEVADLESDMLRLKAQSEDGESLAVIRRQFSEQVALVQKLQSTNRQHATELDRLRRIHKSIEVVEEEKRMLESKLRRMSDLQQELGEAQVRKLQLEDERQAWASYLASQASAEGDLQFDSPEEMARAFMRERLEAVSLVEKLGEMEPELKIKDENITVLEEAKGKLLEEIDKLK